MPRVRVRSGESAYQVIVEACADLSLSICYVFHLAAPLPHVHFLCIIGLRPNRLLSSSFPSSHLSLDQQHPTILYMAVHLADQAPSIHHLRPHPQLVIPVPTAFDPVPPRSHPRLPLPSLPSCRARTPQRISPSSSPLPPPTPRCSTPKPRLARPDHEWRVRHPRR
jgi:hypothetical protein